MGGKNSQMRKIFQHKKLICRESLTDHYIVIFNNKECSRERENCSGTKGKRSKSCYNKGN